MLYQAFDTISPNIFVEDSITSTEGDEKNLFSAIA